MSLRNIINKLKSINKFDIEIEVDAIIRENSDAIISILRNQMAIGIDGNGEPVSAKYGSFYSKFTFDIKKEYSGLAGVTEVVTNYMSGSFYLSIQLNPRGKNNFVFQSGVPHFEEIIARSGEDIMKLNSESTKRLVKEIINPQLKIRRERYENGIS